MSRPTHDMNSSPRPSLERPSAAPRMLEADLDADTCTASRLPLGCSKLIWILRHVLHNDRQVARTPSGLTFFELGIRGQNLLGLTHRLRCRKYIGVKHGLAKLPSIILCLFQVNTSNDLARAGHNVLVSGLMSSPIQPVVWMSAAA